MEGEDKEKEEDKEEKEEKDEMEKKKKKKKLCGSKVRCLQTTPSSVKFLH